MPAAKQIYNNLSKTELNSKWVLWYHSPDDKSCSNLIDPSPSKAT